MGPVRRHRRDHAVERAADARDLADRARARGRQQRGRSSRPSGRRSPRRCSPTSRARPACPTARSTSCRGSARRPAPRSRVIPTSTGSRSPGSIETGKLVAQAAAANLTPVSLELGGKSPFVAFADADLDAVVKQAVNQFDNAGQVCLAGTRLIVERSMHDAFLERFLEAAARDPSGRPARRGHRHRAADHARALRARRRVRAAREGRRRDGRSSAAGPNEDLGGLYYRPTLFADVPDGRRGPAQGGLRARPHAADVRGRGRGDRARERDRLRPRRDRVHRRPRARRARRPSAWSPARSG